MEKKSCSVVLFSFHALFLSSFTSEIKASLFHLVSIVKLYHIKKQGGI